MSSQRLVVTLAAAALGLLSAVAPAAAAVPEQLSDAHGTAGSNPANLTAVGEDVYYAANGGAGHGSELWRFDGVEAELVEDIFPGSGNSNPGNMVAFDGALYFSANDGTHGVELWRSDGTEAGTVMVEEINPAGNASPVNLTVVDGVLYFAANDGPTHGNELWRSEGDEGSTELVEDINPGGISSAPANFVNNQGTLYLVATKAGLGFEPWASDGTEAGTEVIRDIAPGSASSCSPLGPTNTRPVAGADGNLYFSATDGTKGNELWKTDGTELGTVEVADVNPGSATATPFSLTAAGGYVYFSAIQAGIGRELWRSDGTTASLVRDINLGSASSTPSGLRAIGSTVYFNANDGENGAELWRTEGEEANTQMVRNIGPGEGNANPALLVEVEGELFFRAEGESGSELWRSDGTVGGTVQVKDIRTGFFSSSPSELTPLGNSVFFTANDGATGSELWRSDGTAAGTELAADVNQTAAVVAPGAAEVTKVGETIFFTATDVRGTELWRSDGTVEGTEMVTDINPGGSSSAPSNLANVDGILYFRAEDGENGAEPWRSDGTPGGTQLVGDLNPGAGGSFPRAFAGLGGNAFFQATTPATGTEVWKSDGTEAGTAPLLDIIPGPEGAVPPNLLSGLATSITNVGGTLFFVASNGTDGYELWSSDGTPGATAQVRNINPGGDSDPGWIEGDPLGGDLLFNADDGENGVELWRSDGTEAGTVLVRDINPGAPSSLPIGFVDYEGHSYFRADDGANGVELWRTDGTPGGTTLVHDINPGPSSSDPSAREVSGGTLYIVASDEAGFELWRTDGNAVGTVRVKDINPGPGSGAGFLLADAGGSLFLNANDGLAGLELWRSDGSEAGTQLVSDIDPGGGSNPAELTDAGGDLYFTASSGTAAGTQLWKLSTGPSAPEAETLPASAISKDEATLNGSFGGDGQPVEYFFEWGTDASYGNVAPVPSGSSEDVGTVPVSEVLTDLEPNTEYHYRLVATNALGTSAGGDVAFMTDPGIQVTLEGASLVTNTEARLGAFANPGGAAPISGCRFEYGTSPAYGSTAPCEPSVPYSEYTSVTADLTGLQPDTTYHFTVVIENSAEAVQTADATFETTAAENGIFAPAPATPSAAGDGPIALDSDDVNGDGDADVAVANAYPNEVTILLGDGAGGLAATGGSPFAAGVAGPSAIELGDLDGDSKPDLVVAGQSNHRISVFLGDGAGGFDPAPGGSFLSGGTTPASIALGDFDGDSSPDLVVHHRNSGVNLFTNNGSAAFTPVSTLFVGAGSSVALEDVNGDTNADVVATNDGAGTVSVRLGDGAGEFTAPPGSPYSVGGPGTGPWGLDVGDLDGDGKPDLATSNTNGSVSVLLGDGSGGFSDAPGTPHFVGTSELFSLGIGDVDIDGDPDLTTIGFRTNEATTLLGDGSGGFSPHPGGPVGVGAVPTELVTDDFDGNSTPDLAVANLSPNTVTVLLNTTPGDLPSATTDPASDLTTSGATLNGTVDPAGNGEVTDCYFEWGWTTSYGNIVPCEPPVPYATATAVSAGLPSLNFDTEYHFRLVASNAGGTAHGQDQVFSTPTGPPNLTASADMVGATDARFSGTIEPQGPSDITDCYFEYGTTPAFGLTAPCDSPPPYPGGFGQTNVIARAPGLQPGTEYFFRLVATNADGTGHSADLTFTTQVDRNGGFEPPAGSPYSVEPDPSSVAIGDLDEDGAADLVTSSGSKENVTALLGDGSGGFTPAAGSPVPAGGYGAVEVGDVDGDDNLDVAAVNRNSSRVTVLLGDGSGALSPAPGGPVALGTLPEAFALADLDGDGDLDMAAGNSGPAALVVLLNDGTGGFSPAPASPIEAGWLGFSMEVGDVNDDADPDLVIPSYVEGDVVVLLGDGSGGFSPAAGSPFDLGHNPLEFAGPFGVALGDVDGDEDVDLATANVSTSNVTVMLGDGTGAFVSAGHLATGTSPNSIVGADLDGDGDLDLATSNGSGGHNLTILLGDGSGGFTADQDIGLGTNPIAMAIGDLDGAGGPDLAIANQVSGNVTVLLNTAPFSDPDSDGDGLGDAIDPEPSVPSSSFDDGEGNAGTITDRAGLEVSIADAPAPDGVTIVVGPGVGKVSITVCGGFKLKVDAGSEVTVSCGSVKVEVIEGEAEVLLDDGETVVSIPAGATAKVTENEDGSFEVENLGGGDVTVTTDGEETTIEPGDPPLVLEPPVAVDDKLSVSEDAPATTVKVLANDTDPDGGLKEIVSATDPAHGEVVVAGSGASLTYRPDPDYCGSDSFAYTLNGGSTATVSVKVKCVEDEPTAVGDSITVLEDSDRVKIRVLDNDTDPDGGQMWIVSATNPPHGKAKIRRHRTKIYYEPDRDYCGPDHFFYRLNGGSIAKITITVTCVNDPPQTEITDHPKKEIKVSGNSKASVQFKFVSSEPGSTFKCRIDNDDPYLPCSSPKSYSLGKGDYRFQVYAIDSEGLADPTPDSYSFEVKKK